MRKIILTASFVLLTFPAYAEQTLDGVASASYSLEKTHAFLTWSVRHNGTSDYIVNFTDYDATLVFDADTPTNSKLLVVINPKGLNTNYPDPDRKLEWEEQLINSDEFFNSEKFQDIRFISTSIEQTDSFEGTVTGNLTLLGVTKPVTLEVTYNGTVNLPWFGERDIIGFNATTTIKRSDFGMTSFLPVVSDEVKIAFTGEFLQDED